MATPTHAFAHFVITQEPGADAPWLLRVDTYHLPREVLQESQLEPTRHREMADAFQRVLLLAEAWSCGWTIRGDAPGVVAGNHGPA